MLRVTNPVRQHPASGGFVRELPAFVAQELRILLYTSSMCARQFALFGAGAHVFCERQIAEAV
jgi:hypothetical protein